MTIPSTRKDLMIVNMGPHHPSMHGVLRLIVTLDGEDVIDCEPILGYLHRGIEKIAENRTIIQYLPYVTRWDYLAFLIAGHMYRTNFGIGHSMKDLLDAHIPPGGRLGRGHKGLYDTINNSIHFQLGLALASFRVITSLVAQHMYSLPAYAFIAQDFTTQAALYTHHQYIAGFIMTGAFAHGAIFFIRDYNPEQNEDNVLARMLEHKEAIISHLSWASLFLGFHTLGLYVHNDVMLAFGTPEIENSYQRKV
ncbi:photosystem I P700 chlorophyll a apoprotein A2-like [Helianthus annuus]|uniref:photosystem I P700 chlorophyll a apoprotein A2-like n=1 Tax=Helianthus annuus TaxID=4232 RepID=UPI001652E1DE|nr:photosystem I P700 chlorophyll a apoprotein A2-like [Helianthus annuus]